MADEPKLLIHYLVPDDAGPVASGGLVLNTPQGPQRATPRRRYRAACSPDLRIDGVAHRATSLTWCVHCPDCEATEVYRKDYQPHPRTWQGTAPRKGRVAPTRRETPPGPPRSQVVDPDDAGGCCG